MALVTRCPECATLFKVVPDQLRISEGWVRCGHCNEVFDASVDLHQQATESIMTTPLASPAVSNTNADTEPSAPQPWTDADGARPADPAPLHLEFPDPPQLSQFAPDPAPQRDAYDTNAVDNTNGWRNEAAGNAPVAGAAEFESYAATSAEAALEAEFDRELLALEEESAAQLHGDRSTQSEPDFADDGWRSGVRSEASVEHDDAIGRADAADMADAASPVASQNPGEEIDEDEQDAEAEEDLFSESDSVEPSVPDMPSMGEDAVFVAPFVSTAVDEDAGASATPLAPAELSESAPSTALPSASSTASAAAPSSNDFAFLHGANARNNLWRKPAVRLGLAAFAGVLLVMLGLQWLVVQREVVAAHWPQSRALLTTLCAPLGCTVPALRRIDAVAIDSSAFTSLRRGAYRLNVVLKNRGPYALAVPSIELALTDSQEQPVIRRVIPPHELGVSAEAIAANGELVAAVELTVPDADAATRIVGYRLLAFYP